MDSNMYNYGNMWNNYSEGFQPPSLDLQNYMPDSREQNKNPLAPSSSYVFFNYPEEVPHHHDSLNRNQWPFQPWNKLKSRTDPSANSHKRTVDKAVVAKQGEMCIPPAGPSPMRVSPQGPFCASNLTDRFMGEMQRHGGAGHMQKEQVVNNVCEVTDRTLYSSFNPNIVSSQRNMTRKNPTPRKRKEKKKKADAPKKKRTRDEESWARNKRKNARAKGESYVSVLGKTVPARSVKPVDCSKCKFSCPSRVSEEDRKMLFKTYWELETFKAKVDFICSSVHEFVPLRPVSGRRAFSRRYMLKVDGKDQRVCKEFFISTFDISESTIVTYMNKKRKGTDEIEDLRGKQTPSNKTPEEVIRNIREHILYQTGLQGELFKQNTDEVKNVKLLYKHYHEECKSEDKKPASISVYRKIFADMHKDRTSKPVDLPPPDVLIQASKKMKTPCEGEEKMPGEMQEQREITSSPEPDLCDCEATSQESEGSSSVQAPSAMNAPPPTAFDMSLMVNNFPCNSGNFSEGESQYSKRVCDLNIPQTMHQPHNHPEAQHHPHQPPQQQQQQQQQRQLSQQLPHAASEKTYTSYQAETAEEKMTLNTMLPFVWDSSQGASHAHNHHQNIGYGPTAFPEHMQAYAPTSTHSGLASSLFSYQISSTSTTSVVVPPSQSSNFDPVLKAANQAPCNVSVSISQKNLVSNRSRKPKEKRVKKEAKKRERNEELWGRNIRKRLRFKGEAYTSVKGKLVEAKHVRNVDCSKCKFKCTSRVCEEEREKLNLFYWSQDTYKKKIEFITKCVQTYTPKRKLTGRRAYSRKYVFEIDGVEERVCKDFFKATLHISESTIATALDKTRKGPEAIVDMRGKHKPVNKTTEETLQIIRELIIYITGLRPHRSGNKNKLGAEYKDVNRLYQIYKYDCEKKGHKVASLGIFRGVLSKDFLINGKSKPKKSRTSEGPETVNSRGQMTSSGSSPQKATRGDFDKSLENQHPLIPLTLYTGTSSTQTAGPSSSEGIKNQQYPSMVYP